MEHFDATESWRPVFTSIINVIFLKGTENISLLYTIIQFPCPQITISHKLIKELPGAFIRIVIETRKTGSLISRPRSLV